MKTINGKRIKITNTGYLYIDNKKITERRCTPLNLAELYRVVNDHNINDYIRQWVWKRYTMV